MNLAFVFASGLLCLFLSGCGISNERIIQEVKLCHDAGMKAKVLRGDGPIIGIECIPAEESNQ